MEALAAVALTGNILQFVEFSTKVVSRSKQFQKSVDGNLKEHSDLRLISNDLRHHLDRLSTDESGDETLNALVKRCMEVGTDPKGALDKVSGQNAKGHVWSSYFKALRSVWSDETIKDKEEVLERLRSQVQFHLQVVLHKGILDLTEQVQKLSSRSQHAQLTILDSKRQEWQQREEERKRIEKLHAESTRICDSVLSKLEEGATYPDEVITRMRRFQFLQREVFDPEPSQAKFLATFEFRGMHDREEAIPEAHERTYEWLLMDVHKDSPDAQILSKFQQERLEIRKGIETRFGELGINKQQYEAIFPPDMEDLVRFRNLQDWLRADKGLFWIWAKPGAGKSTLMKAIQQRGSLQENLQAFLAEWASGTKPITASFYFFKAGTELQKSLRGLLQSLLYQIFSQRPDLISSVFEFKAQREAIARSARLGGFDTSVWTLPELIGTVNSLSKIPELRIFFSIDGIDEMDGFAKEIATLLRTMVDKNPNIKILAAGRWRAEFNHIFGNQNCLNFHEAIKLDIVKYCTEKLDQPCLWEVLDSPLQLLDIVAEIVSAAEGVFLWVYLVVELVLEGSQHFENFDQLQLRLKEYPRDLDSLYHYLLKSIDKRYQSDAAFWLLCVFISQSRIVSEYSGFGPTTLILVKADTIDINDRGSLCKLFEHREPIERQEFRCKSLGERMRRQCLHFFELGSGQGLMLTRHITFTHRTVLDFIGQEHIARELEEMVKPRGNPAFAMFAAFLAQDLKQRGTINAIMSLRETMISVFKGVLGYHLDADTQSTSKFFKLCLPQFMLCLNTKVELGHCLYVADLCETYHNPIFRDGLTIIGTLKPKADPDGFTGFRQHSLISLYKPNHSKVEDSLRVLDGMTLEQRNDLLSAMVWTASFSKSATLWPFPAVVTAWVQSAFNLVFPNKLPPNSSVWGRCLRVIRAKCLAGCGLEIDFIEWFLTSGADPNQLCPPIDEDPDKSYLSLLSIFQRATAWWHLKRGQGIELPQVIERLKERGAIEISREDETEKSQNVR